MAVKKGSNISVLTAPAWGKAIDRLARFIRKPGFPLLVCVVCGFTLVYFASIADLNNYYRAWVSDLIYGTAWRPYVYRTLVPTLVRLLTPYVPVQLADNAREIPWVNGLMLRIEGDSFPREALLVLIFMYLSLLGFYIALRRLAEATGRPKSISKWIALVGVVASLIIAFHGYIYDHTQMFLFTLALALMALKRWRLYLAVFALACLSKETTVLLLLVYLATTPKEEWSKRLIMAQLAIYALIKGALYVAFFNNPGSAVEWHFFEQLLFIDMFPMAAALAFLAFALIGGLVAWGWKRKPLFLRQAMVIFPVVLVLYWLFGFPFEIRVFMEVYPLVFLLVLPAGGSRH